MKIYKYKFTKLITAFIYIGLALSVIAFGFNTYSVIVYDFAGAANLVYPILQYTLTYFIAITLFVILVSLLISSYYSLDEKNFITSFGIIKSKYAIEKIQSIVLDRKTNKLSVYFDENNFIVVVVGEDWYEEFITQLLMFNPKIEYTINSKENEIDKKD